MADTITIKSKIFIILSGYVVNLVAFLCGGAVPTISIILSKLLIIPLPNWSFFEESQKIDYFELGKQHFLCENEISVL